MKNKARVRRQNGAVLIEGVAGISLVIAGLISLILLLLNCSLVVLYKQKLGFVANQTAHYATENFPCWNNGFPYADRSATVDAQTKTFANSLLKTLGLPAARAITIEKTADCVAVTIQLDGAGLLGVASKIFPKTIGLQDTGVALYTDDQPPALARLIDLSNPQQQVLIPVYGRVIQPITSRRNQAGGAGVPAGTAILQNFDRNYASFDIIVPNEMGVTLDGYARSRAAAAGR